MKNDSAPGPDGYILEFFKANYDLVGQDFMDILGYFFTNNFIYYSMNITTISFIPKVDVPIKMNDFIPISC